MNNNSVIEMFASQVYGDGECFLFRISPNSKCWRWKPELNSLEDDEETEEKSALLEQFMFGREKFISMGGNHDGSAGVAHQRRSNQGGFCNGKWLP